VRKRNRNNFIGLAVVHLLLLIYPLISKTVHVHHGELAQFEFTDHQSFSNLKEICPIYNFEFYNFVATGLPASITYLKSIPVYNAPENSIRFVPVVNYFSLRAPPVA